MFYVVAVWCAFTCNSAGWFPGALGNLVCPCGYDTGTGKLALAHTTRKVRRFDALATVAEPDQSVVAEAAEAASVERDEQIVLAVAVDVGHMDRVDERCARDLPR